MLGEEDRAPYDRVGLTLVLRRARPRRPHARRRRSCGTTRACTLRTGAAVAGIDREARTVTDRRRRRVGYDDLVLATGSYACVPPVHGADLPGCFVYRTLDDVAALRDWVASARGRARPAVCAAPWSAAGCSGSRPPARCRRSASRRTSCEFAPRLMPLQVDEGGGEALRRLIEALGVDGAHRQP